jgi:hypothetical protein
MRTTTIPLPNLAFVIGTRAALAAGVALLAGGRLRSEQRRWIGLSLIAVGAATTIPAARWVFGGLSGSHSVEPDCSN